VGRFARRLLVQQDIAMPLNLVDPKSKMDYFTAATMLSKMGYAASIPRTSRQFRTGRTCSCPRRHRHRHRPQHHGDPGGLQHLRQQSANETYACSSWIRPMRFPAPASTSPVTVISRIATITISSRRSTRGEPSASRTTTPCKSRSASVSARPAGDFNYAGPNPWIGLRPRSAWELPVPTTTRRSSYLAREPIARVSDFDAAHQINSNWIYELPFGRRRKFGSGANRLADAVIGGWQLAASSAGPAVILRRG